MSSFTPSLSTAKAALGSGTSLEHREHPSGIEGACKSFEEVAKKIREGRIDPRVRAWAGDVLVKAGRPKDVTQQASALLRALRQQAMYVPDPVGAEMVVSAKNTLCLDEHGLCIKIGDCDDLCVALGSALMSVGIPTKLVGQSFNNAKVPSHVLLAIETPAGWKKIDPSHSSWDVGQSHRASHEWMIDPMEEGAVSLSGGSSSGYAGDFVGISGVFVTDDTVRAKKILIDGTLMGVDQAVDRCTLPEPTRIAWKAFATGWKAFYNSKEGWITAGTEADIADQFELQLKKWQSTLAIYGCAKDVPLAAQEASDKLSPLLSTVRTVAIVAGVIAVARYIVWPIASEFMPKRSSG